MITLSILIPTTTKRAEMFFAPMVDHLQEQIDNLGRNDIEILGFLDNYKYTIGEKRNKLLDLAIGKFTLFVDDDDRVTSNFLPEIMRVIDQNPDTDCIVYDMLCTINGCRTIHSKFGIEYEYTKMAPWSDENCNVRNIIPEQWFGKPSHNMVWAARISKTARFPNKNAGEDFDWVAKVWPKIRKQSRIDKVIYYYDAVLGKDY